MPPTDPGEGDVDDDDASSALGRCQTHVRTSPLAVPGQPRRRPLVRPRVPEGRTRPVGRVRPHLEASSLEAQLLFAEVGSLAVSTENESCHAGGCGPLPVWTRTERCLTLTKASDHRWRCHQQRVVVVTSCRRGREIVVAPKPGRELPTVLVLLYYHLLLLTLLRILEWGGDPERRRHEKPSGPARPPFGLRGRPW